MNAVKVNGYCRISKARARKLFDDGKSITLCPHKMIPGGQWQCQYDLGSSAIAKWKEQAERYSPTGVSPSDMLWMGNINKTAWDLMYNNWAAYNTDAEQGYYAAYYIVSTS